MRLRPLTEAECYVRCYGGSNGDRVSVVRLPPERMPRRAPAGEALRMLFEERLDARGPEAEAA